jgi:hypothetical protein
MFFPPIPVAARSKAQVYGRSVPGIAGSNFAGGLGCLSVVSVVCCKVEVSALDLSLVQRSPIVCVCVCVCHLVRAGAPVTLYIYHE